MPRVWVSAGSNIDRESNMRAGLDALRERFGELIVSPVYEAEAVGFDGDSFLNMVIGFDSELPPGVLHELMREIEAQQDRDRSAGKFAPRTLDLDILTYGDQVSDRGGKALPRDEILGYGFVLAPLADVAGDERHPALGVSYRDLWSQRAALYPEALVRLDTPDWLTR